MSMDNLQQNVTATDTGSITSDTATTDMIAGIRSENDDARRAAWRRAALVGAPAVAPLAALLSEESPDIAQAAERALWGIVRHAGRPGADSEQQAVSAALVPLLSDDRMGSVRREVLWMLSEIGGSATVQPIAALLSNQDLREDARMSLERIPGDESLLALRKAVRAAPDDFKPNLAQSLRRRGEKVDEFASAKLVPTKRTEVRELQSTP
jgi:HEAT repeat protein